MKILHNTDLVKPELIFLNTHPLKTLLFPVPQYFEAEAKSQLTEMINDNTISTSNSSWACPMLLVKKKIRFKST